MMWHERLRMMLARPILRGRSRREEALQEWVQEYASILESFLIERVYHHPEVVKMDTRGQETIAALIATYRAKPDEMPDRFDIEQLVK